MTSVSPTEEISDEIVNAVEIISIYIEGIFITM